MKPANSIFFDSAYLTISHTIGHPYLYAHWKGELTEGQVRTGCNEITNCIVRSGITSVFNDNTCVKGCWLHAVEWSVDEWFPEARKAGLRYFAWIYSKDRTAHIPMDTAMTFGTMKYGPSDVIGVKTFYDTKEAAIWLAAMTEKQPEMS